MKLKNQNILVWVSVIILIIASFLAVTYAWFSAGVEGESSEMSVTTANLRLVFTDSADIHRENMYPGDYINKTFTVKNEGTDTIYYDLIFELLENTFIDKSELVYTLTSDNGGAVKTETVVPSETGYIETLIEIEQGVTQTYELIVTFKETHSNQNDNQGKTLYGKIVISSEYELNQSTINNIVEETVYNGNTPVNQALVTFNSDPVSTMTDENGYYKVENLPIGKHTIEIEKEGNNYGNIEIYILPDKATNKRGTTIARKTSENKYVVDISLEEDEIEYVAEKSVEITLDNQSATTAGTTSVTATYDSAMPSITIPTRNGYTFMGYYTGTNGTGTQYYNADGTSTRAWNIVSATTLYAKWIINNYQLTINPNGGYWEDASLYFDGVDDYVAVANYGEAFRGVTLAIRLKWYTTSTTEYLLYHDDSYSLYAQGNQIYFCVEINNACGRQVGYTSPTTLAGQWLTIVARDTGTAMSIWINGTKVAENAFTQLSTISANSNPTYLGVQANGKRINAHISYVYEFLGWLGDSQIISYFGTVPNVTNTTAMLSGTNYTNGISNTNEDATTNRTYTMNYNTTKNIPIPGKFGYTFTGWSKSCASSTISNTTFTMGTCDTTLTANYTTNTYAVTLNNQSATTAGTTSVTATYNANMPNITIPTKTGYTFGGYYTGTNGTGTQYYTATGASTRAWNLTSATTLYAKWSPKLLTSVVSRASYVKYYGSNGCTNTSYCSSSSTTSNWRVAYVANNSVYLISAGVLESVNYGGNAANTISSVNAAALTYCNPTYAYGATCNSNSGFNIDNGRFLTMMGSTTGCYGQATSICGTGDVLADLDTRYWIATYAYTNANTGKEEVMIWSPTSHYIVSVIIASYLRPMVRLNTDVKWNGVGNGSANSPYGIMR